MNREIKISEGRVFLISDELGNINRKELQGFFFDDVRHLSFFQTYINGDYLDLIDANQTKYNRAVLVKKNRESPFLPRESLTLIEDRILDDGMFETIKFLNNSNGKLSFTFEIRLGVDFADIFDLREKFLNISKIKSSPKQRQTFMKHNDPENKLTFSFRRDGYERETYVEFSQDFKSRGNSAFFEISLEPHSSYDLSLRLSTLNQSKEKFSPNDQVYSLTKKQEILSSQNPFPKLQTDWDNLKNLYEKSISDLEILKIEQTEPNGEKIFYTAGGLPWFMTLFGRDSAITAYQMLGFDNRFAIGVLKTLSKYQGKVEDHENEEEPGKIIHEMRFGEAAYFKDWVKFPYYGTIDATMIFLKLYVGLYKFYAGDPFFLSLKDNVLLALEWLNNYGDLDGDGFIEYQRKSEKGLRNQNWRDSEDSMMFSDGALAQSPIASADVQGYVYDVKRSLAKIADREWNEKALAEKLTLEAESLRNKFNKEFWVEDGEFFALGLDKDKRKIDTKASSMGHLLWSEIVDEEKEIKIVDHLMSDDMFSGWGIRTITKKSGSYNPLGYHLGTVWPHDNSIIVRGLHKRGYKKEAMKVIEAMVGAASHLSYSLPELFSGYGLETSAFPIIYPKACDPQAWASGTVLMFIKTILGIEMNYWEKTFSVNPIPSNKYNFLSLKGFEIYQKKYDITVYNGEVKIEESK